MSIKTIANHLSYANSYYYNVGKVFAAIGIARIVEEISKGFFLTVSAEVHNAPILSSCSKEEPTILPSVFDYQAQLYKENSKYANVVDQISTILSEGNSAHQIDRLQDLAYLLFSKMDEIKLTHSPHHQILRIAFFANAADPADIATILLKTYEIWMPDLDVEEATFDASASKAATSFPRWHENKPGVSQNTKIKVSHGGGCRFLRDFFKRKNDGYARESNGKGIFVTVHHPKFASARETDRDLLYATRTPLFHYDSPCTFEGKIEAQYIHRVNHNAYEAVLFAENLDKLYIEGAIEPYSIRQQPSLVKFNMLQEVLPRGDFTEAGVDYSRRLWSRIANDYSPERLERFKKYMREVNPHAVG